ncbi:MAG: molybdenum cofactor biosynthesis protein MoaE [Planctomycetes bacterium]|nr:molybdenum cofactor biosynthesis protein MoaE [Planctomycetota bacterium]
MTVPSITDRPIDEREVVRAVARHGAGAVLTFAGTVRSEHLGRPVTSIEYHAYETMAARELARIEEEAARRWPDVAARIVHRVGLLQVGETSVLIAVSSPHRAEGFEALRFAIESVKERAPIWKKEIYPDGHAWLEGS